MSSTESNLEPTRGESGLVWFSPNDLEPSPENEQLYADTDQSLAEFGKHLGQDGVLEPLVITQDCFVVSGHRRRAAAIRAGLGLVPCRFLSIKRSDVPTDRYIKLLRDFNRQRSKSIDEILRESVIDADPEAAYESLVESRVKKARNSSGTFDIIGSKRRAEISENKMPMLEAVLKAIKDREKFWPLSVRQVHYCLLCLIVRRHAKKPGNLYQNDRASYQDLCDLICRGRIAGKIPWDAIGDETRPVRLWRTFRNVAGFVEKELSDLFDHYWRDLLQSQANHYEIIIEKNASLGVIENVAAKYCISTTSGRGHTSKVKLREISERFRRSAKDRLVLLILSDFDPDGDAIANANARSLRDDIGLDQDQIVPVRVALRPDQIQKYRLPKSLEAKETSSSYDRFVARHGVTYAVELEALDPADLQAELDKAIRSYIDVDLFNQEVEKEKQEAAKLNSLKADVLRFLEGRAA